ncbi:MAG: helix-turn-helix domain-containing protein [Gemmatimonadetes bacterium]|nr:helix-turn-helix domain-containing protein [Gemmatimonadota bacterium]
MNKLSDEKRAMILRALVEGNSIRATARLTGTSKNTVSRLLRHVGGYCLEQHDNLVRGVESERVQCDEIWSFVGCKESQVPKDKKRQGPWGRVDVDGAVPGLKADDRLPRRLPDRRDRLAVHAGSSRPPGEPRAPIDRWSRRLSPGCRACVRVGQGGLRHDDQNLWPVFRGPEALQPARVPGSR